MSAIKEPLQFRPHPSIERLPSDQHWIGSMLDGLVLPPEAIVFGAFLPSGEIVGRTSLMALAFIEGTQVKEEYRGTSLAMRLVKTVEDTQRGLGGTHIMAMAPNDEIAGYLKRFGYEQLPVTVWAKDLTKGEEK